MTDAPLYAPPRIVTRAQDCDFYHTLELPGHGLVQGAWDLRGGLDRYLGHTRFAGKRVLDVGTATGCLTFYMEQQGAEVVSYDLCPGMSWDIVPYAGNDMDQIRRQVRLNVSRYNDGYWFCYRALKSKARMVYGSVYDIRNPSARWIWPSAGASCCTCATRSWRWRTPADWRARR
jgi:hypothetical protein